MNNELRLFKFREFYTTPSTTSPGNRMAESTIILTPNQARLRAKRLQENDEVSRVAYTDQGPAYVGDFTDEMGTQFSLNARGEFTFTHQDELHAFRLIVRSCHTLAVLYHMSHAERTQVDPRVFQAYRNSPAHLWNVEFPGGHRREVRDWAGDIREQLAPTLIPYLDKYFEDRYGKKITK